MKIWLYLTCAAALLLAVLGNSAFQQERVMRKRQALFRPLGGMGMGLAGASADASANALGGGFGGFGGGAASADASAAALAGGLGYGRPLPYGYY